MCTRGQLFPRGSPGFDGPIARERRLRHAERPSCCRRDRRPLCARVDYRGNPGSIEQHRKEQIIAARPAGTDVGLLTCPAPPEVSARPLLIQTHAMARKVDSDVKAAENIGAE